MRVHCHGKAERRRRGGEDTALAALISRFFHSSKERELRVRLKRERNWGVIYGEIDFGWRERGSKLLVELLSH